MTLICPLRMSFSKFSSAVTYRVSSPCPELGERCNQSFEVSALQSPFDFITKACVPEWSSNDSTPFPVLSQTPFCCTVTLVFSDDPTRPIIMVPLRELVDGLAEIFNGNVALPSPLSCPGVIQAGYALTSHSALLCTLMSWSLLVGGRSLTLRTSVVM